MLRIAHLLPAKQPPAVASDLGYERVEFSFAACRHHDFCALCGEQSCGSTTDACAGSSDDGDFSCQAVHVQSPVSSRVDAQCVDRSERTIEFRSEYRKTKNAGISFSFLE
jgi:hypothetical protein